MQRLIILITTGLGLAACDPLGKDAGEVESTDSAGETSGTAGASTADGTADGATETDEAPVETEIEWSMELGDVSILHMIPSPEGVVAVLQNGPPDVDAEVVEVSSSMELLWSKALPEAWISDLNALGGGEYVLAGSADTNEPVPTAWRLSCCGDTWTQAYGDPDPSTWVAIAEPFGDGVLMVLDHGDLTMDPTSTVVQAPLGLTPEVPIGSYPLGALDSSRTASGSVLVTATEGGGAYVLLEIPPDGMATVYGSGEYTALVGSGDELTLMTFGNQQVFVQPYGGGAVVPAPTPGVQIEEPRLAARGERIVVAYRLDDPAGGSFVRVVEFQDDGVVDRMLDLPRLQYDYITLSAITVGEDDAIYVAVYESEPGGFMGYLHRIAPL